MAATEASSGHPLCLSKTQQEEEGRLRVNAATAAGDTNLLLPSDKCFHPLSFVISGSNGWKCFNAYDNGKQFISFCYLFMNK